MTKANKKLKILNLYACLGGNRYKWDEIQDIQVTAVELDPELAKLYKKRFPNDIVIVDDAHNYLLNNYDQFDFIWTSPPCPSHSRARNYNTKYKAVYPDLKLYEEIILLQNRFKGKYVVENVIPYYNPLIEGQKRGRHIYWANFKIPYILTTRKSPPMGIANNEFNKFCDFHQVNLNGYKGDQSKLKIVRNLVDYEAGKTIFKQAVNIINQKKLKPLQLFTI
jgi:DNA (cytosine-5)-methyltransferase 1